LIIISDTLFIGKELHFFPELPSTNQTAFDLVSKSKPSEGTTVFTFRQTAGRGQIGSRWDSELDKNIALSVILYPKSLPVRKQFMLNKAISLAVRDVVSDCLPQHYLPVCVKWSNDIYVGQEKIAGILIQNGVSGTHLQYSVIGIGLNVNQMKFADFVPNATSLQLQSGQMYDLELILKQICQKLEQYYLLLKFGHFDRLDALYLQHLYQYQQLALYQRLDGRVFRGTILGVTDIGRLQILTDAKELETFDLKEIKFCL
jgi:BirA family transcriptional regulator, biotin operon repressor / biotin---[acetyl-CoA-carboxylase] ligase